MRIASTMSAAPMRYSPEAAPEHDDDRAGRFLVFGVGGDRGAHAGGDQAG